MITASERDAWLEQKRKTVGASELSALFGCNPYLTPLKLWGLKTGRIAPEPENLAMRLGTRLEPIIADEYCRATGREVFPDVVFPKGASVMRFGSMAMYAMDDAPLSCTPDRIIAPILWREAMQLGVCQLKATNPHLSHEWGRLEDGTCEVPLRTQIQVQAEMAVLGAAWGSAAVLIGGCDFRYADIDRNERFAESAMKKAEEFMWHVRNDKAPPDLRPEDVDTVKELYPRELEGTVIALPPEAAEITSRWELAKEAVSHNEAIVDHCKAAITMMLGEAEKGLLPDGSAWTFKTRKGCTVKAHDVVDARILRKVKK